MKSVKHDSRRRLVAGFQKNGRRWTRDRYMKLDEDRRGRQKISSAQEWRS
jgi:hypothetical protein